MASDRPTEGALRAAQQVNIIFGDPIYRSGGDAIADAARVIDRESGHQELLAAWDEITTFAEIGGDAGFPDDDEPILIPCWRLRKLYHAIARARATGGE